LDKIRHLQNLVCNDELFTQITATKEALRHKSEYDDQRLTEFSLLCYALDACPSESETFYEAMINRLYQLEKRARER
jgi:hypothetical protein